MNAFLKLLTTKVVGLNLWLEQSRDVLKFDSRIYTLEGWLGQRGKNAFAFFDT